MTEPAAPEIHATATQLDIGPFNGWFTPHSALFELHPALDDGNCTVHYMVISGLDGEGKYPAETMGFATDIVGLLDGDVYQMHGAVAELFGENNPHKMLRDLGYHQIIGI